MGRYYTIELSVDRRVCIDGVYRCPNPACGFAGRVRAWGFGAAKATNGSSAPVEHIPSKDIAFAKETAEGAAWTAAHKSYARVACPRCMGQQDASVQFFPL
jgi:hypothetical protein